MSALGTLLGVGYGNRMMNDADKRDLEHQKVKNQLEASRRAYPTINEESAQLQGLDPESGTNPLEQLLRYVGKETDSDRSLQSAQEEYYRSGKPDMGIMDELRRAQIKNYETDNELAKAEAERRKKETQEKIDKQFDEDTLKWGEKYDKELSPFGRNLKILEEQIQPGIGEGFNFDSFDFNKETYKNPSGQTKKLNTPMADVGGKIMPQFIDRIFNKKGSDLRSTIESVIAPETHALFGSSRTGSELKTINELYQKGALNSEAAMVNALKRLANTMKDEYGEREAKFAMTKLGQNVLTGKEKQGATTYRSRYNVGNKMQEQPHDINAIKEELKSRGLK